MPEKTLVLLKPEALKWGVAGDVIKELSNTKLRLIGAKLVKVTLELAEKHYKAHKGKPFFENLIKHITGQFHKENVVALVYAGENAISRVRAISGDTDPSKAEPNTIRAKFGKPKIEIGVFENVMHTSGNKEEAEEEIKLWFKPSELTEKVFETKKVGVCVEQEVWK